MNTFYSRYAFQPLVDGSTESRFAGQIIGKGGATIKRLIETARQHGHDRVRFDIVANTGVRISALSQVGADFGYSLISTHIANLTSGCNFIKRHTSDGCSSKPCKKTIDVGDITRRQFGEMCTAVKWTRVTYDYPLLTMETMNPADLIVLEQAISRIASLIKPTIQIVSTENTVSLSQSTSVSFKQMRDQHKPRETSSTKKNRKRRTARARKTTTPSPVWTPATVPTTIPTSISEYNTTIKSNRFSINFSTVPKKSTIVKM